MYKKILGIISLCLLCLGVASCSKGYGPSGMYDSADKFYPSEDYLELDEKGFTLTEDNPRVNVSLDSSNAAYSNIRRMINNEYVIYKDSVNIEQMLNYFNYSYENTSNEQLDSFLEIAKCPWNEGNMLLAYAVKAKDFVIEESKPNNFVFLLDVSGSMYSENKLPLMINAFKILIDNLNDNDRVSIVTYAGSERVLVEGAYGYEKPKLSAIINDLTAGGSTAGSKGIQTAYQLAEKYYIEGGNNRVFLATDGDFNVGIYSTTALKTFISAKRLTGVYLSLFGFGEGNLKSSTMDTLAQAGNGNYYYIDSILEAQKVFVDELGGTLQTVAKDAKSQLEFNASVVEKYRVIGYENKILTDEEFEDSETDAGEIGAGHTTICLVEFTLKDGVSLTGEETIVKSILRYKDVLDNELNKELIKECKNITNSPSDNFLFASGVAEFGLILRNSSYKENASLESVYERVNQEKFTKDPYKKEFAELVLKVKEAPSKYIQDLFIQDQENE